MVFDSHLCLNVNKRNATPIEKLETHFCYENLF